MFEFNSLSPPPPFSPPPKKSPHKPKKATPQVLNCLVWVLHRILFHHVSIYHQNAKYFLKLWKVKTSKEIKASNLCQIRRTWEKLVKNKVGVVCRLAARHENAQRCPSFVVLKAQRYKQAEIKHRETVEKSLKYILNYCLEHYLLYFSIVVVHFTPVRFDLCQHKTFVKRTIFTFFHIHKCTNKNTIHYV